MKRREKKTYPTNLTDSQWNIVDGLLNDKRTQLLKDRFNSLIKIIADGFYRGELIENTKVSFGLILEVILRKDDSPKFQVIPKRWVVE